MPIVIIIINNGGIYMGMEASSTADMQSRISTTPVTSLSPASCARYELIAEAFGGRGFHVTQPHEVQPALAAALKLSTPSIINIVINPGAGRRAQEFDWLTRKSSL
jgi:thiamine pyrophosphate-dependent acetolactate synthase large subunit-like protein